MTTLEPTVIIRIPKSHWLQIVSDIENMCGCNSDEIEILSKVEIADG